MYSHDAPFLHAVKFSTQNIWSLIVYLGKRLLHVFLLFHLQIMLLPDTGCENYNGLNFEGCVLSPSWFCRHNACLPCLFLFSLAILLLVGEIYTGLIKLMGWKSLAVGIVLCSSWSCLACSICWMSSLHAVGHCMYYTSHIYPHSLGCCI